MCRLPSLANLVTPDVAERALGAILVLNLFDALATLFWVHGGFATEANPVMAQAMESGPAPFILAKVALVTLAAGLLWRLREHHMARLALIPLGLLYAGVCGGHVGFGVLAGAVAALPPEVSSLLPAVA